MGIGRDSRHKRRETGGKRAKFRKKRKFELARPGANTKMGTKRVHHVRTMGGNTKWRALRLESGNFSWGTEVCTRKSRIIDVVYNASNNELVRTKTLVKGAIILIDGTPFRNWYEQFYGKQLGKRRGKDDAGLEKRSARVQRKLDGRCKGHKVEASLEEQFSGGRILARISSRPGQSGRCDGYILEGPELDFYKKKLATKKSKK